LTTKKWREATGKNFLRTWRRSLFEIQIKCARKKVTFLPQKQLALKKAQEDLKKNEHPSSRTGGRNGASLHASCPNRPARRYYQCRNGPERR
jgi:hypothetical protein